MEWLVLALSSPAQLSAFRRKFDYLNEETRQVLLATDPTEELKLPLQQRVRWCPTNGERRVTFFEPKYDQWHLARPALTQLHRKFPARRCGSGPSSSPGVSCASGPSRGRTWSITGRPATLWACRMTGCP